MASDLADVMAVSLDRPSPGGARRRAWLCVLAAAGGATASAQWSWVWPAWWIAASVLAIGAVLARGRIAGVLLLAAVGAMAGGWLALRTETVPGNSIERWVRADESTLVAVEGVVVSSPAEPMPPRDELARFRFGGSSAYFDLSVDLLETSQGPAAVRGRIRVYVSETSSGDFGGLGPGDVVRVRGWFQPPQASLNPGDGDRLRWARLSGRSGSLSTSSVELVERVSRERGAGARGVIRAMGALRARAAEALEGDASLGRGIMRALLLGEEDPSLRETRSAFAATGTSHLLAISGFHLAVLCGVAGAGIRLSGERGSLEPLVLAALVVLVLVLVPARVPIVRAGVMVLALLACDALGRRYDRLTMLAWVSMGILIWRPMDAFSMGAQLSVGITALLLWIGSSGHRWFAPIAIKGVKRSRRSLVQRALRRAGQAFAICVACWAFSLPTVLHHTGQLNVLGAITTALVTPLIVALLGVGYLGLMVHLLAPGVAEPVFDVLIAGAEAGGNLIERVSSIRGVAPMLSPPSALWAAGMTVVLAVYVRDARVWNGRALASLALLLVWLMVTSGGNRALGTGVALRLDALAVGDGSCWLVRSGREALLWDCGSLRSDLRPMLERAQRALGVREASRAIVTHADLDHYISLPDAIDLLGVERVLAPEHVLIEKNAPLRALHASMRARGLEVDVISQGEAMTLGGASLHVLWPPRNADFASDNDVSVVCRIDVPTRAGMRRVLLTGDIQPAAMSVLLGEGGAIWADVLELPHHGSFSMRAWEFVEAVSPKIVVQSTGPRRADDERWNSARRERVWYTTATDGAAWVEIMQDGSVRSGSMRR
jgi:competence protein ComEC